MDKTRLATPLLILFVLLFFLRIVFMLNAELLVEEAYYWNYSNHLDFSFLDHPPMVALLIKLGTLIFNVTEWGVRFATIPCWILTSYFSFKLTVSIQKDAGLYAIMLLAILPFFFVHSLIITPDIPLILCWSAALYYLYQALILEKARCWYWVGIWIGCGMLSKYTIVLLGLATLVFLIVDPKSRKWFLKKEPYCCALIALIIFTPVIYWNATHHWVSFLFQTSRRFHDYYTFSFHELIGLVLVYLTPTGIFGAWMLFSAKYPKKSMPLRTLLFFQIYIAVPLLFFSFFSLFHGIKINWIGPIFLAILPWLAIQLADNQKIMGITFRKGWAISFVVMLFVYSSLIYCILATKLNNKDYLFNNLIHWDKLSREMYTLAQQLEKKSHHPVVIVPLDSYHIASEYSFYQQKLFTQGKITTVYPVVGSHVFGFNSLMYQYWGGIDEIRDKNLILITQQKSLFPVLHMSRKTSPISPIQPIGYHDKRQSSAVFYYELVKMA